MKYIDSEKLTEHLYKMLERHPKNYYILTILDYITSLQQEQSDKYETALKEARKWMPNVNQGGHTILISIFPELGEGLDPLYGGRKHEQPVVDLEKEMNKLISLEYVNQPDDEWEMCIAHYFYELGLNARKEE